MTGRIVILNGAPRSGKSSIVAAMQERIAGRWLNLGVDVMAAALPATLRPGIGLRPGGERPDLEPAVELLFVGLYDTIASHSRLGFDVVVDVGHHDVHSAPRDILTRCAERLSGLSVLFVGVDCPDEIVVARRKASSQGALYATDLATTRRWREAVHAVDCYDLRVDTSAHTPQSAADTIAQSLAAMPSPTAFERLAEGQK